MAVSLLVNQNLENGNRDVNNEDLDNKNNYLEDIHWDAGRKYLALQQRT